MILKFVGVSFIVFLLIACGTANPPANVTITKYEAVDGICKNLDVANPEECEQALNSPNKKCWRSTSGLREIWVSENKETEYLVDTTIGVYRETNSGVKLLHEYEREFSPEQLFFEGCRLVESSFNLIKYKIERAEKKVLNYSFLVSSAADAQVETVQEKISQCVNYCKPKSPNSHLCIAFDSSSLGGDMTGGFKFLANELVRSDSEITYEILLNKFGVENNQCARTNLIITDSELYNSGQSCLYKAKVPLLGVDEKLTLNFANFILLKQKITDSSVMFTSLSQPPPVEMEFENESTNELYGGIVTGFLVSNDKIIISNDGSAGCYKIQLK